jgi:hypothetical protein
MTETGPPALVLPVRSSSGQIQPWYHIRASHELYGKTFAASTGYM